MIPSIDEQIKAMREKWPAFKVVSRSERSASWRGSLRPNFMTFEIGMTYVVPLVIETINPLRQQPLVKVLKPVLQKRYGDTEGDLPHVYWDDPVFPSLCLFDHEARQWSPCDLLADTTVPWTIDWLACYEGWRATGKWTGGGRHVATTITETST